MESTIVRMERNFKMNNFFSQEYVAIRAKFEGDGIIRFNIYHGIAFQDNWIGTIKYNTRTFKWVAEPRRAFSSVHEYPMEAAEAILKAERESNGR